MDAPLAPRSVQQVLNPQTDAHVLARLRVSHPEVCGKLLADAALYKLWERPTINVQEYQPLTQLSHSMRHDGRLQNGLSAFLEYIELRALHPENLQPWSSWLQSKYDAFDTNSTYGNRASIGFILRASKYPDAVNFFPPQWLDTWVAYLSDRFTGYYQHIKRWQQHVDALAATNIEGSAWQAVYEWVHDPTWGPEAVLARAHQALPWEFGDKFTRVESLLNKAVLEEGKYFHFPLHLTYRTALANWGKTILTHLAPFLDKVVLRQQNWQIAYVKGWWDLHLRPYLQGRPHESVIQEEMERLIKSTSKEEWWNEDWDDAWDAVYTYVQSCNKMVRYSVVCRLFPEFQWLNPDNHLSFIIPDRIIQYTRFMVTAPSVHYLMLLHGSDYAEEFMQSEARHSLQLHDTPEIKRTLANFVIAAIRAWCLYPPENQNDSMRDVSQWPLAGGFDSTKRQVWDYLNRKTVNPSAASDVIKQNVLTKLKDEMSSEIVSIRDASLLKLATQKEWIAEAGRAKHLPASLSEWK